ncbi:MAG: hypothetical protein HC827_08980 [Cyanobacteria bacterium RM1_2_2]|nr:hypothetical protein [Cyanobacteria bacterium RM1_2_2]
MNFGFAFAQHGASNFWMVEALRSHGFSLRSAASSVLNRYGLLMFSVFPKWLALGLLDL